MSTFLGKYDAKADVKGRIFIPSTYRKILPEAERERIVMRHDLEKDCLILYPQSIWENTVNLMKSTLDLWDTTDQMILTQFTSLAEFLDLDSQGRVLISKKHLQSIGIENQEVLFVGMIDRFSIWNKERYEKALLPNEEFARILKQRMSGK